MKINIKIKIKRKIKIMACLCSSAYMFDSGDYLAGIFGDNEFRQLFYAE